jgi:hypothetical protein
MTTPTDLADLADLAELAERIDAEARAVYHEAATAQERGRHAWAAGELLNEAKGRLPRGAWLAWLRASCHAVKPRTAQKWMYLARRLEAEGRPWPAAGPAEAGG